MKSILKIFIMRSILEWSYEEIATKFNRSANWACVTYFRVRKDIKDYLEGQEYE